MRIIRLRPARERHFLAGVELNALGALDVQVAEERAVPAGEREPGHRRRHADVDADHARVEMLLELPGGVTAAREDRRAVAEFAFVADGDRFVEIARRGPPTAPGRKSLPSKPASRASRWSTTLGPSKKAVRVEIAAAIERDRRAFALGDVQIAGDAIAVLGPNHRTHVDVFVAIRRADAHLAGIVDQILDHRIARFTNGDRHAARHAPLAGTADTRSRPAAFTV